MSSHEPAPRFISSPFDGELLRVGSRLRDVARALEQRFLGKES
jgi:hypothetical protein